MKNSDIKNDQKPLDEPSRRSFHLEKTLQAVTDVFAAEVSLKDLSYSLKLDRGIPTWLAGDEGYLRRILIHLVRNAVDFTDEGGVTVEVRQDEAVGQWLKLHISVIDTGCGIADADLAPLLENPSSASGTGLADSLQLAARMGGHLGATSQDGWGSHFWFTLPLAVGSAAEATATEPLEHDLETTRGDRHILLAEDNKVNQKVALGMLRKLGYSGVVADNGEQALELLARSEFDLVFMDLQMPEMGGLDATRKIREGAAGPQNRDIPIIAMTGHATRQDRRNCLNAGMNGYVTKPISSARIREAIGKLAAGNTESTSNGSPFSMAKLVMLMNGDTDLAVEILDIFQVDTDARLQRLAAAISGYDFATVDIESRAIEGGALNVCAENMVNLSRELCRAAGNKEQEYATSLIDEMILEMAAMQQRV